MFSRIKSHVYDVLSYKQAEVLYFLLNIKFASEYTEEIISLFIHLSLKML